MWFIHVNDKRDALSEAFGSCSQPASQRVTVLHQLNDRSTERADSCMGGRQQIVSMV